jgi:hypothetical protein
LQGGRSGSNDGPKRSSQPVASCAEAFFEALPEEQAAVVPQASPRGAAAGVRRKGHAVHACVWNGNVHPCSFLKATNTLFITKNLKTKQSIHTCQNREKKYATRTSSFLF